MVGSYVIEDEYTIRLKVRRESNSSVPLSEEDPQVELKIGSSCDPVEVSKVSLQIDSDLKNPTERLVLKINDSSLKEEEHKKNVKFMTTPINLSKKNIISFDRQSSFSSSSGYDTGESDKTFDYDRKNMSQSTISDLPSVRIYAEDSSLIAKNNFKAPPSTTTKNSGCLYVASIPSAKSFNDVQPNKPSGPGTLFIKPISKHLSEGNGELYVAPVDKTLLNRSHYPVLLKGNSKRIKSKPNSPSDNILLNSTKLSREYLNNNSNLTSSTSSKFTSSDDCRIGITSFSSVNPPGYFRFTVETSLDDGGRGAQDREEEDEVCKIRKQKATKNHYLSRSDCENGANNKDTLFNYDESLPPLSKDQDSFSYYYPRNKFLLTEIEDPLLIPDGGWRKTGPRLPLLSPPPQEKSSSRGAKGPHFYRRTTTNHQHSSSRKRTPSEGFWDCTPSYRGEESTCHILNSLLI